MWQQEFDSVVPKVQGLQLYRPTRYVGELVKRILRSTLENDSSSLTPNDSFRQVFTAPCPASILSIASMIAAGPALCPKPSPPPKSLTCF